MERRGFLASLGLLVALPGCVSDVPEGSSGTERSTTSTTERSTTPTAENGTTATTDPGTTTDDCGWPQFCDGSTMVEVVVSSGFSGTVVLEAKCRDEEFEIPPGETKTLTRQVDAETCDVALYLDGREAYSDTVHDYESTTLRVDSIGEVHAETVEL